MFVFLSDVLITNETKISKGLIIPCFFILMTSCENQELAMNPRDFMVSVTQLLPLQDNLLKSIEI